MKNEDIKIIEDNLKEIKIKISAIKEIDKFNKELHETKSLNIYSKGALCISQIYDVIGKEFSEMLEQKKIQLQEEIHNFTLDQLLPSPIKKCLGFKFKTARSIVDPDDGVYYFDAAEDGLSGTCSWFLNGELKSTNYGKESMEICINNFRSGIWKRA